MIWTVIPWAILVLASIGAIAFFVKGFEATAVGFLIAAVISIIVASVMTAGLAIEQKGCERLGRSLNVPVVWEVVGGCYAQIDGYLVPTENLRFIDSKTGLLIQMEGD